MANGVFGRRKMNQSMHIMSSHALSLTFAFAFTFRFLSFLLSTSHKALFLSLSICRSIPFCASLLFHSSLSLQSNPHFDSINSFISILHHFHTLDTSKWFHCVLLCHQLRCITVFSFSPSTATTIIITSAPLLFSFFFAA